MLVKTTIPLTLKPIERNPDYTLRYSRGACMLSSKVTGNLLRLNESAELVWQLADGTRCIQRIVETIRTDLGHNVPGILDDVLVVVDELSRLGVFVGGDESELGHVYVRKRDRLGNQMFIYCAGRILALKLGFVLHCQPVEGFPNTEHRFQKYNLDKIQSGEHDLVVDGPDALQIAATNPQSRTIVLDGWFQNHTWLNSYREEICKYWFNDENAPSTPPGENDIVLHVRGGDCWEWNRSVDSTAHEILSYSYYARILDSLDFDKLYIISEQHDDPIALALADKYGGMLTSSFQIEDFRFLRSANRVILSISTFSWWAAWLSDAVEIHLPVCNYFGRDGNNRFRKLGFDLVVRDDPRYQCHEVLAQTDLIRTGTTSEFTRDFYGHTNPQPGQVDGIESVDAIVLASSTAPEELLRCIEGLSDNLFGLRDIHYLADAPIEAPGCTWLDPERLEFAEIDVANHLGFYEYDDNHISSKYYKQLAALSLPLLVSNGADYVVVIDASVVLKDSLRVIHKARSLYLTRGRQKHRHMAHVSCMLPGLVSPFDSTHVSGFDDVLIVEPAILEDLDTKLRAIHGVSFWRAYLSAINQQGRLFDAASSSLLYYCFATGHHFCKFEELSLSVSESADSVGVNAKLSSRHSLLLQESFSRDYIYGGNRSRVHEIVVISLKTAVKRRERIETQLEWLSSNFQYRIFDAVVGTMLTEKEIRANCTRRGYDNYVRHKDRAWRGSITANSMACALSWKKLISSIQANTMIMEDDAILCDDFERLFLQSMSYVPSDWDIIYLSWNQNMWPKGEPINASVRRIGFRTHGTGCMILNPVAREQLLSIFPLDLQIDHDLPDRLIVPGRLNAYMLTHNGKPLVKNDNFGGSTTQR